MPAPARAAGSPSAATTPAPGSAAAKKRRKLEIGGGVAGAVVIFLYLRSKSSSTTSSTTAAAPVASSTPASGFAPAYGYGATGGSEAQVAALQGEFTSLQSQLSALGAASPGASTGSSVTVPDTTAAPAGAAATTAIIEPPTGTSAGTPIPVGTQQGISSSNSGYFGEPMGYSPSQTPQQNALAEELYANPGSGSAAGAYRASIGAAS